MGETAHERVAVGIDLTGPVGDELVDDVVVARCRAAVEAHGVVVFRDANVDDDQLVAFSRLLGDVLPVARGAVPGHPEVSPVAQDPAKDKMAAYRTGTFFWHIDGATDLIPNKSTLLTALALDDGAADGDGDGAGDTEFASTYAAYESLPTSEQDELADVRVVHSFAASQLLTQPDPTPEQRASWEQVPPREHPLVWARDDGRRSLLIGATAGEVVGRPPDEGRALLDRLLEWATQPEFVLRHRWRRGDLVVWDNTGMLHRARPYRASSPRLMHRTTIAGEEAIR
jgi:alpha-ketoglutarate-dependent taurine dioxygenase